MFSGLVTRNQAVLVTPRIPEEDVTQMCKQGHLSEVPDLCVFVMSHISLTLYSFDFHKCSDVSWCGVKRSPSQFQVLSV